MENLKSEFNFFKKLILTGFFLNQELETTLVVSEIMHLIAPYILFT